MLKKLISTFFVFAACYSSNTKADIYTPVVLNMTSEQLNTILNSSFKDGLVLDNELKEVPKIKGLKVQAESIRYSAKFVPHFEILKDGVVKLNISIQDIKFKIDNFAVQYKLTQNQGSLRVNVFTKIDCDSLTIKSARHVDINALGTIKAHQPWVGDLNFTEAPEFDILSNNCEAPGNYKEKLTEIATEWLVSDEGKEKLIELVNNDVISEYWNDFKKGLEFNFVGRKIYIALVELNIEELLSAKVQIRWPYREQIYLNTRFPDANQIFTYSIDDLKKVLTDWIPKECFQLRFTRAELPAAEDLFNSRFMQFFAWSDLMNFPKDIDFRFYVKLCVSNLNIKHALKNGIKFDHNSIVMAQLNLIIDNKERPYVVAHGKGSGEMSVVSTDTGMGLQLEKSNFTMEARFHSKMAEWRGNKKYSGTPSMSMIFPRVIKGLEEKPIAIAEEFTSLLRDLKFTSGKGYLHLSK